ncbi:hypothetical protein IV203_012713 [Nitzschia inconspicua]|uniref:Uncharacterized protein n=1 Tax=Nitzschia inconspicua TaxID=303405 RepID=A0A9K3P838_9STRA|nr:hypothetical protein IV203_012713 [Nitzschia inconspicua]
MKAGDAEQEQETSSIGLKASSKRCMKISTFQQMKMSLFFFKPSVTNNLYRHNELEDVCLYDFLAKYSACKPAKNKILNWVRPHPSKNHLKIRPLKEERVPGINYLDFLDTKRFEGNNMFTRDIETIPS